MRLYKEFKVENFSIGIIIALLAVSVTFYGYNQALPDSLINVNGNEQGYEKFSGEKISLNSQGKDLNGVWGDLELVPYIIQPTNEFLMKEINADELFKTFQSSNRWIFKGATLKDISMLFLQAGLSKETCEKLLEHTTAVPDGKGFITTPPDAIVWSFTPEIRAKLYPLIGKYGDNVMYSYPVCYNSADREEWFYHSSLSEELMKKILPLVYTEKGICYISDIHLILPLLCSEDDRISLLQTLYRTKALDAYLKIEEGMEVTKITDYWGNLGRADSIKPILEHVSNQSGGGKININELLPAIPQNRLNTYSSMEEYETDYKDCHWTTLNFFNDYPDERYYNLTDLFSLIHMISKPLKNTQLKFGDIVTIFDENNEVTHSCIYIADQVVLTKNGMGNLKPFVITYLDKTVLLYGEKTVYYSRTVANTHSIQVESLE